jgi:hypothetical protein
MNKSIPSGFIDLIKRLNLMPSGVKSEGLNGRSSAL